MFNTNVENNLIIFVFCLINVLHFLLNVVFWFSPWHSWLMLSTQIFYIKPKQFASCKYICILISLSTFDDVSRANIVFLYIESKQICITSSKQWFINSKYSTITLSMNQYFASVFIRIIYIYILETKRKT